MSKNLTVLVLAILLTSCSALPAVKELIKPDSGIRVEADLQAGGQREIGVQDESTIKLQTGDTSQTSVETDLWQQTNNTIQEYPLWLILAFALAVGLALPSPTAAYSSWRERARNRQLIDNLIKSLTALHKTSTTKPVESPTPGNWQLQTSP